MTTRTTNGTQRIQPRRRRKLVSFLVNGLLGIALAMLTYKAWTVLPSFYEELQVLGIIEQPAVSTAGLRLLGCAVIALLYLVSPLLGGVIAVFSLVLPVAMLSPIYAVPYLVFSVLSVIALTQRGAPLLIALVPLAVFYPPVALLLPLIPALAAILYGRAFGPYLAACAVLALVLLGLLGGLQAVGGVYLGGDVDPVMDSEILPDYDLTIIPPSFYDDARFVEGYREGNIGVKVGVLYLFLQWAGPILFLGAGIVYFDLFPILLAPAPVALFVLWGAAAVAVSWLTWAATKRRKVWALLGTAAAAIAGTLATTAGHLVIPRVFGAASTLPSVFQGITSAVLSAIAAAMIAVMVAWARSARVPAAQPAEITAVTAAVPAPGAAAPIGASSSAVSAEM